MKTISKKIKSIYLLAIMAILSVCVAVFPAFKTQSVKAEEESVGLSVTGASLKFGERNTYNDFVLMFQAEITKDWYTAISTEADVKVGMVIGPTAKIGEIETFDEIDDISDGTEGNAFVYEFNKVIDFKGEETVFTYEAGTLYSAFVGGYENLTDDDWKKMYAVDLTAIPFYSVNDNVVLVSDNKFKTSASQEALETLYEETANPVEQATLSVENAAFISGKTFKEVYTETNRDIFFDQSQNMFMANFHAGYWTIVDNVRPWSPYRFDKQSGGFLTGSSFNTHLAGQLFTSTKSNAWNNKGVHKLTAADLADVSNHLKNTKPGTYVCYYTNPDTKEIEWFDYIVATRVFTNLSGPAKGQGAINESLGTNIGPVARIMTEAAAEKEAENPGTGATIQGSYFAFDTDGSKFFMPYGCKNGTYEYEKESYDGYYVLGNDIVVPGPVDGSSIDNSQFANLTSWGIHAPPTSQATIRRQSIGAVKGMQTTPYLNSVTIRNISGGFTGTFDGRGHTIKASFVRGGIFGFIMGGTVKNLNIDADLYYHDVVSSIPKYDKSSYAEKNAILAEVIADGSTLENISINLTADAPETFEFYTHKSTTLPEMDQVPGLLAAQTIRNSTLKNVIVRIDSLQYAKTSLQNYRAALNVTGCTLENVFVIGSSYTNMSISTTTTDDVTTYLLTLSAPEGVKPGTYTQGDDSINEAYFAMAADMFKYLNNVDVSNGVLKVKFVKEPATKKFANESDFQTWITDPANVKVRRAFTDTKMWTLDKETGKLVWANAYGENDPDFKVYEGTLADPILPSVANPFGWTDYNPTIVLADGTILGATAE